MKTILFVLLGVLFNLTLTLSSINAQTITMTKVDRIEVRPKYTYQHFLVQWEVPSHEVKVSIVKKFKTMYGTFTFKSGHPPDGGLREEWFITPKGKILDGFPTACETQADCEELGGMPGMRGPSYFCHWGCDFEDGVEINGELYLVMGSQVWKYDLSEDNFIRIFDFNYMVDERIKIKNKILYSLFPEDGQNIFAGFLYYENGKWKIVEYEGPESRTWFPMLKWIEEGKKLIIETLVKEELIKIVFNSKNFTFSWNIKNIFEDTYWSHMMCGDFESAMDVAKYILKNENFIFETALMSKMSKLNQKDKLQDSPSCK